MTSDTTFPDGLRADHTRKPSRAQNAARPLPALALAGVMVAALSGLAGAERSISESANGVHATWESPYRIRNGEFFEMRLTVAADRPLEELSVGVDASLWEDFTVNTFFPAAAEERSAGGELRFEFGRLDAGEQLLVKVDAQINPDMLWRNEGTVTIYDGEQRLLEIPAVIEVLP